MGKLTTKFYALVVGLVAITALIPGVNGTHDPNDFFVTEATFPGVTWNHVHGVGANVYAVGTDGSNNARFAVRSGGVWTLTTPPTASGLTGVYAASTTSIHAVQGAPEGFNKPIWEYNGAIWSPFIPTNDENNYYSDIWGFSPTLNVVAGTIGNNDAGVWRGTNYDLDFRAPDEVGEIPICPGILTGFTCHGETISATGTNDIWFTFERAQAGVFTNFGYHFSGGAWATIPGFTTDARIRDSWPAATNAFWFVGLSGSIQQWDGSDLNTITSPTMNHLAGIWGTSGSDIWAVGAAGTIIHYDGTTWTLEPSTTAQDLNAVWCLNATNCWAVGTGGIIQKLAINIATAIPNLTGLQWDPADMIVTADDACLGGEVALGVNLEPSLGAGGLNAYVINDDTGIVVETWTAAGFQYNQQNKRLSVSKSYPPGEYTFEVTADVIGLLTPDNWAAESFNVDSGTCFTPSDKTEINNRFDTLENNLTELINTVENNLTEIIENIDIIVNQTIGENLLEIMLMAFQPLLVFLPLLLLAGLIVWAEYAKDLMLYLIALLSTAIVVLAWPELEWARLILVMVCLWLSARAYQAKKGLDLEDENT